MTFMKKNVTKDGIIVLSVKKAQKYGSKDFCILNTDIKVLKRLIKEAESKKKKFKLPFFIHLSPDVSFLFD